MKRTTLLILALTYAVMGVNADVKDAGTAPWVDSGPRRTLRASTNWVGGVLPAPM